MNPPFSGHSTCHAQTITKRNYQIQTRAFHGNPANFCFFFLLWPVSNGQIWKGKINVSGIIKWRKEKSARRTPPLPSYPSTRVPGYLHRTAFAYDEFHSFYIISLARGRNRVFGSETHIAQHRHQSSDTCCLVLRPRKTDRNKSQTIGVRWSVKKIYITRVTQLDRTFHNELNGRI